MVQECMRVVDDHQTYYYLEMVSDCWLFIRLQFISSVFIGILSILTIFHRNTSQPEEQPSGTGADMAGLRYSYNFLQFILNVSILPFLFQ